MKLLVALVLGATTIALGAEPARAAATVAVMPVQAVNLSEGDADAIGVLLASAFARETRVVVASPMETKPVLAEAKTTLAAAHRLGVFEYIEVQAVQLGNKITLGTIRYNREGKEIYRAEAVSFGLDDMPRITAHLAHVLAWTQPAQRRLDQVPDVPPAQPPEPKRYPAALGVKSAAIFPVASGRTFTSLMSLQFDARIGPRTSFAEVGAGFALPATAGQSTSTLEMGGVFAEFGGGLYLSEGSVAPYVGGGVSPRIWVVTSSASGVDSTVGATCTVHGMAGVNFTRDNRARVFSELRIAQYILGLSNNVSTLDGTMRSGTYYPTEFSLQFGIGW